MDNKTQPQRPQGSVNAELMNTEALGLQIPLSERPRIVGKDTSCIDRLELLKESRRTEEEVQKSKNVKLVLEDTDAIIKFGLKNSKEQQQIQNELKALLDHEQKIIQQILDRAMKFKEFKDESRESADKFEDEHNLRIPFYSQFLKQLAELPETQNVTQEGMPKAVQAKILYNIVENTTHAANNTIVQLSMEKTLMNDMDLSMEKLRNFANFMITNFQTWNKNIGSQEKTLNQIIANYNKLIEDINKIEDTKSIDDASMKPEQVVDVMKSIEERLKALESELKTIKSQTAVCVERTPSPKQKLDCRRVPPANNCAPRQTCPECPPPCPTPKRSDNCERPMESLCSPPCPEDRLHAGQDQCSPRSSTPRSSKPSYSPYSSELPKTFNQGSKSPSPDIHVSCPQLCSDSPLKPSYMHDDFTPDSFNTSQEPPRYPKYPSAQNAEHSPASPEQSPMTGNQQSSPELLYKIQDDLKNLSQRNHHLKDLYANFRQMRKLLMEEMDTALRLNQKLQNDLRNLSEEEKF